MLYGGSLLNLRPKVYRGTALQAGGSRVRFPECIIGIFFTGIILPVALCSWGRLSLYQKWVPGIFPWGKGGRCVRLTNLTNLMCRLSWNLGASTAWNPLRLSGPVMGLIYLLPKVYWAVIYYLYSANNTTQFALSCWVDIVKRAHTLNGLRK